MNKDIVMFKDISDMFQKRTKTFSVSLFYNPYPLGVIEWDNIHKEYLFVSNDWHCRLTRIYLRVITNFCDKLMEERK